MSNTLNPRESKFPAVADIAEQIRLMLAEEQDSAQALKVWSRLVSDPRMDLVWRELYKRRKGSRNEFVYPGRVGNKSIAAGLQQRASEIRNKGDTLSEQERDLLKVLEYEVRYLNKKKDAFADARWNEQDRAVQIFFRHTYKAAIHRELILLSDLEAKAKKARDTAIALRNQAEIKSALGSKDEARTLRDMADDYDGEALRILPDSDFRPGVDDPWIVTRRRGNFELRTFLADLMICNETLFGKPLWGTIATIANVVFDRRDITRSKVREMFRF